MVLISRDSAFFRVYHDSIQGLLWLYGLLRVYYGLSQNLS